MRSAHYVSHVLVRRRSHPLQDGRRLHRHWMLRSSTTSMHRPLVSIITVPNVASGVILVVLGGILGRRFTTTTECGSPGRQWFRPRPGSNTRPGSLGRSAAGRVRRTRPCPRTAAAATTTTTGAATATVHVWSHLVRRLLVLHHLSPILLVRPILMIVLPLTLHLNLHRLTHVPMLILILILMLIRNRLRRRRRHRRRGRRRRRGHRPAHLSRVRVAVVRPPRRLVRVGEPPRRQADPPHRLTGVGVGVGGRWGGCEIVPTTATQDATYKRW